jgi:hypothetical protein
MGGKGLPGPIPKRENREFLPPRVRAPNPPGRIASLSGKRRSRKWLLWSLLLSIVVAAAAGLSLPVGIWPFTLFHQTISSALQDIRHKFEPSDATRTPYLVFEESKASINQPLPLGIALKNGLGGETVVLSGIVEGTSLSAGSPLTETRWSVPGRDLDKTFVSAPKDFDGAMEVTVTLYSSRQDVLETKRTRFSWSGSGKGDKLPVTLPSAQYPAR